MEGLSISPGLSTGLLGFILGIVVPFLTYLVQRKKTHIDQSALVFEEWRELLDANKERINGLESRIKMVEGENSTLRERVSTVEKELQDERNKRRVLEDENHKLKQQIVGLSHASGTYTNAGSTAEHPDKGTWHTDAPIFEDESK